VKWTASGRDQRPDQTGLCDVLTTNTSQAPRLASTSSPSPADRARSTRSRLHFRQSASRAVVHRDVGRPERREVAGRRRLATGGRFARVTDRERSTQFRAPAVKEGSLAMIARAENCARTIHKMQPGSSGSNSARSREHESTLAAAFHGSAMTDGEGWGWRRRTPPSNDAIYFNGQEHRPLVREAMRAAWNGCARTGTGGGQNQAARVGTADVVCTGSGRGNRKSVHETMKNCGSPRVSRSGNSCRMRPFAYSHTTASPCSRVMHTARAFEPSARWSALTHRLIRL